MKKEIFTILLALSVMSVNAQLKVYTSGKTFLGDTSTTPNSLLSVGGAGSSGYSGYFYNPNTGSSKWALRGETATPGAAAEKGHGLGGLITSGTGYAFGGYFYSYNSTASPSGRSYGIKAVAGNATSGYNYGVYGRLAGSHNGAGIVGSTSSDPDIPAQYAAYFDGQIRTTNDDPLKPNGGSWVGASDERLKTNITPFEDGINVIRKINPINYNFNGKGNLPTNKPFIGVKAQDMQKIAPYTVGTMPFIVDQSDAGNFTVLENIPADSSGSKAVVEALSFNYDGLIYVLINAVKELDSTVTVLESELNNASLKTANEQLNETHRESSLNGEPSKNTNAILYQNDPNPFDQETRIRYSIPVTATSASIMLFDMQGKPVKTYPINDYEKGSLEINGNELYSGMFIYSLLVDGKLVDTKKMILTD